jgi:hypothetical protein
LDLDRAWDPQSAFHAIIKSSADSSQNGEYKSLDFQTDALWYVLARLVLLDRKRVNRKPLAKSRHIFVYFSGPECDNPGLQLCRISQAIEMLQDKALLGGHV